MTRGAAQQNAALVSKLSYTCARQLPDRIASHRSGARSMQNGVRACSVASIESGQWSLNYEFLMRWDEWTVRPAALTEIAAALETTKICS